MKVNVEDAGPCRKIMHVSVPAENVQPEYEKVLDAFAEAGSVPGFRRGKAPRTVVERHYAKKISEETKDRLVGPSYREALEQVGITPVAIVDVSQVDFQKAVGLDFRVTLDVAPQFKLPRYKKISVKGSKVEVSAEDEERALDGLRNRLATFEDIEDRPVQAEDLVMLDYAGTCEGQTVSELASDCSGLGEATDFWTMVAEPEVLPGFNAGLTGAPVGETREVPVHFPDDYHVAAVAGKDAVYQVTVKALRQKKLPEVNEEFLKQFNMESEEALRARLREDLLADAERREKAHVREVISKHLLGKTTMDVPQTVLMQETRLAIRNIVQSISRDGATGDQIEEHRDSIFKAAEESSRERIKISYLLNRIADEEGIEVTREEVDGRVAELAQRQGMAPERFRAELEKRNAIERLTSDIREDKAMDFLIEHAKIKR